MTVEALTRIQAFGSKLPERGDWFKKITPEIAGTDSRFEPWLGYYYVTTGRDLVQLGEVVSGLSIYRQIVYDITRSRMAKEHVETVVDALSEGM